MTDLRPYRLTILLNSQSASDERSTIESLVKTWVTDHQGEIRAFTAEEKRKLFYAIARQRQATRLQAVFTAPGGQVHELLERLGREAAVLRARLLQSEPPTGKRLADTPDRRFKEGDRAPEEKTRGKEKTPLKKLDEKIEEILEEKVV